LSRLPANMAPLVIFLHRLGLENDTPSDCACIMHGFAHGSLDKSS
jgi:hypothetical protein